MLNKKKPKNDDIISGSNGFMIEEEIIFQSSRTEYLNIEDKIAPENFYDFSALSTGDKFRPVKVQARIGIEPYSLMSAFRMEAMKMAETDFIRALVSIGIVALSRQRNLSSHLIEPTIKLYSGYRIQTMDKRFNVTLELVDFDKQQSIDLVDRIVCSRPRNDKYGVLLWSKLHPVWSRKVPSYTRAEKWHINPSLIKKCKSFVNGGLTDKMFELSAKARKSNVDTQNPSVTIRISRRFTILSYEYAKFHCAGKLPGQLFRGYFMAGLYILSTWAINKKLSDYEFHFKKMIHELEIQACIAQNNS